MHKSCVYDLRALLRYDLSFCFNRLSSIKKIYVTPLMKFGLYIIHRPQSKLWAIISYFSMESNNAEIDFDLN